jgi:hypothetical protein
MRRQIKRADSLVIAGGWRYIVGNSANNEQIRDILLAEQGNICCYTEIYLARAVKAELDHFDPTLKDKPSDSYYNWYAISGVWNNEKSNKWSKHQPVLKPEAEDFEERIIYSDGDYLVVNPADTEAKNLFELLNLGDPDLADQRKRYIARMKDNIATAGETANEYFADLMDSYPEGVYFIRALKEVFGYVHQYY